MVKKKTINTLSDTHRIELYAHVPCGIMHTTIIHGN